MAQCSIDPALVHRVLDTLREIAIETIRDTDVFSVPGMVKFELQRKSAIPAHTVVNPFTQEPMTLPARPAAARVRVKVLPRLSREVTPSEDEEALD